ncbi:MAG TPA: hypothetical protein VG672_16560 [Bryobacteraceae bacterium]|nr:hypothetical protein [Bryobacteraceae bacterium]
MSSRALAPTLSVSGYAAPFTGSRTLDSIATPAETEWPAEAIVDGRKLLKGIGWALAIEGAAALVLYGAWDMHHLGR